MTILGGSDERDAGRWGVCERHVGAIRACEVSARAPICMHVQQFRS